MLAKNPAGWQEILDVVDATPRNTPVVIALNAQTNDGVDTSWIWNVDFDRLRGRKLICTGERGADLSVCLRYRDLDHVRAGDLDASLRALRTQPVTVIANYSAFQQARRLLSGG